jgi:hypothetical protein
MELKEEIVLRIVGIDRKVVVTAASIKKSNRNRNEILFFFIIVVVVRIAPLQHTYTQ